MPVALHGAFLGKASLAVDWSLCGLAPDVARTPQELQAAQPEMARGIATGVLHKNTVARTFSRLTKKVAALA